VAFDRVKIFDSPQELTDQIRIQRFDANWNVWWGGVQSEEQSEPTSGVAAPKWSPEMTGDMTEHGRTVVHDASSIHDARRR
jgi:hypothetical protein